ncbi:MAG: hypothetical protein ABIO23_04115 [Chitinophagales bacterium]
MGQLNKPRMRRDNVYSGAFLGLVFPVLGFLLYWVFFFSPSMTIGEYWDFLFASGNMSGALSLAIILNLAVFLYNLSNHNHETVNGIVVSTIFYGVLIIIFKFL